MTCEMRYANDRIKTEGEMKTTNGVIECCRFES